MAGVFFTSDIHLGHKAVLDFDNRPWDDVDTMNREMIERWNKKVGRGDHVYILGDLCWLSGEKAAKLIRLLNGNLHLIRGNHDRVKGSGYKELFHSIKDYDVLKVSLANGERKQVVLSHYPIMLYNGHRNGAIHLYGHVHTTDEYPVVEDMIKLLHEKGIRCEMYNTWCGFYDWAPATLDEIISYHKGISIG